MPRQESIDHMLKRLLLPLSVIMLVSPLAGCGDTSVTQTTDDTSVKKVRGQTEEPSASVEGPESEDVDEFFRAIATYDQQGLAEARQRAVPGSIADAYVMYIAAFSQAASDAGVSNILGGDTARVSKVDDGWQSCQPGQSDDECVVWGDVEAKGSKIASFTVNGKKLGPLLSRGDGSRVKVGNLGSVQFLVAYKSVESGTVYVLLDVRSKDRPIHPAFYEATYRAPDGRQSKADGSVSVGSDSLGAHSTATIAIGFPNAAVGGTVTLPLQSDDFMSSMDAVISTRG